MTKDTSKLTSHTKHLTHIARIKLKNNDSYENTKPTLFHFNDHFSSFSSNIDQNQLKFTKQQSHDPNVRLNDFGPIGKENYMNMSNRVNSEYELSQKTIHSINSFYQNESIAQKPYFAQKDVMHHIKASRSKNKYSNSSSIEPAYSVNAITLNKNHSCHSNHSRVSQRTIPIQSILPRETMNLKPQFQSPDVVINTSRNQNSSIIIQKNMKVSSNGFNTGVSRNGKNALVKSKIMSHSLFKNDQTGVQCVVPHSSVKISKQYLKSKLLVVNHVDWNIGSTKTKKSKALLASKGSNKAKKTNIHNLGKKLSNARKSDSKSRMFAFKVILKYL